MSRGEPWRSEDWQGQWQSGSKWAKRPWSASASGSSTGGGLTPSVPPGRSGTGRQWPDPAGSSKAKFKNPPQQEDEPDQVFHLMLPFSGNYMSDGGEGVSWINQCKADALRFGCRFSWRVARRVPLKNPGEKPPYVLTVVGKMGAKILGNLQDDIWRTWPLQTPPPAQTRIEGLAWEDTDSGEQSVYTFQMPGAGDHPPIDVRMFSFKGLAAARKARREEHNDEPMIKSQAPKLETATSRAWLAPVGCGLTQSERTFCQLIWRGIKALGEQITLPPDLKDWGLATLVAGLGEPNTVKRLLGVPCCLCITTMGRDWQVQHALPIAIGLAWTYKEVTLYLVDFNKNRNLEQWVLDNLALPMEMGKLKYYRCSLLSHWHASLAKNTAHMAACLDGGLTPSEAVLVNLDGDNVFTPKWLTKLLEQDGPRLLSGQLTVIHYQNVNDPGTYGRLAYLKSLFVGVRGYDTSFWPVGCQDTDLLNRLGKGGLVLKIKNHWVGNSFCNAAQSGIPEVDTVENYKAPHLF